MVVIPGKSLLIQLLIVASFTKLSHVKAFDFPHLILPDLGMWNTPVVRPPYYISPQITESPPPPSTDSVFIPPFLVGPIIDPILPGIPSITNPMPSSQLSPPLIKSPPSPSQRKTSPPDQSAKLTPPTPAKQPPPSRASSPSPPPTPPPSITNPPVMAPSPSSPVAKPPVIPRRPVKPILPPPLLAPKILTVNGVVYCKPCNSYGVPNLLNASPLQGASARLVCYNGKNAIVQSGITDKNGEFRITPKSLIEADIGKCKVYLVKSPNPTCNVPTNFNGGKTGAQLQHAVPPNPPIVTPAVVIPVQQPISDLFGVGPFIFEASSKMPCAMHKKL